MATNKILLCAFNKRIAKELETKLTNARVSKDSSIPWSKQQRDIFDWIENGEGNLVARARAGTGKTTTLIEGISRVPGAMAEAKTLHSLGYGLVMRNWGKLNLDNKARARGLAIEAMETDEPKAIVSLVARLMTLGREMHPLATKGSQLLDIAYEFECDPDEKYYQSGWSIERVCDLAARAMELATRKTPVIDFADMLFLPVRNGWASPKYDLTCVDEAQDMNYCQLELAQRVTKKNGRILVVGDDCQAIYGFRGADSDSIDRLKEELNAGELPLNITYRCPSKIVNEAKRLVPDYEAAPSAPEGIIDNAMVSAIHKHAEAGDFVLSRTNAALTKTCLHLLRNNIRAKIEGKDIGRRLATIVKKVSKNSTYLSVVEFEALLTEWRNKETAKAIAKDRESRAALIMDQAETISVLGEGMSTVREILFRIDDLFGEAAEQKGVVVCSTVHRAKGLEASRVFILRETLYPGRREQYGDARMREECNIEYVAITRAMERLTWVSGKL
jgi:superfamily I DNA/RNA helicase